MPEAATLALIDRIYDAAMDQTVWPDMLDDLATAFRGVGVSMVSLAGGPPSLGTSRSLAEADIVYRAGWWEKDSIIAEAKRHGLGPGIHVYHDFVTEEFKARDAFFQDFLRPIGSSGSLNMVASPFDGVLISVSIQRRLDASRVGLGERRRYAGVARHLSRALAMGLRLSTADAVSRGLASRLDHFDCAVAVLERDGRLLLSNVAFDRLRADGVLVRNGRVVLAQPRMQARLEALIWSVIEGAPGAQGPDMLAVSRPMSLLPLLIRAVPVTPERAERHLGCVPARAALLMVLNPEHAAYPKLTTALQALGLTSAQARVALAIGGGQSPRETAEQLRISEATVRTTVKHIYAKLGIDRQSLLARLVARALPFSA